MDWTPIGSLVSANGGELSNGVLALFLLIGAWWTVRRIITGDLVPRIVHEDIRTERDLWRETAQSSAEQLRASVAALEVTNRLLESLQRAVETGHVEKGS